MQDRHEVNKKAIEYAKQVRLTRQLVTVQEVYTARTSHALPLDAQARSMAIIAHFGRNMVPKFILQPCLQAIVLAPHRALPHVAACISMGRLAVFSDNKTKVWRQTCRVGCPGSCRCQMREGHACVFQGSGSAVLPWDISSVITHPPCCILHFVSREGSLPQGKIWRDTCGNGYGTI